MFSLLLAFLPWVGLSLILKHMQLNEIDLIPSYLLVWFFVQISNLCFQYLQIRPHGAVTLRVARDGNKGCTVVWRSRRLVWQIRTLRFFSEYFPKRLERLILTKYVEMFYYNEYNFFFVPLWVRSISSLIFQTKLSFWSLKEQTSCSQYAVQIWSANRLRKFGHQANENVIMNVCIHT